MHDIAVFSSWIKNFVIQKFQNRGWMTLATVLHQFGEQPPDQHHYINCHVVSVKMRVTLLCSLITQWGIKLQASPLKLECWFEIYEHFWHKNRIFITYCLRLREHFLSDCILDFFQPVIETHHYRLNSRTYNFFDMFGWKSCKSCILHSNISPECCMVHP